MLPFGNTSQCTFLSLPSNIEMDVIDGITFIHLLQRLYIIDLLKLFFVKQNKFVNEFSKLTLLMKNYDLVNP